MKYADLDKAIELRMRRNGLKELLQELNGSVRIDVTHKQGNTSFSDVFTRGAVTSNELRHFLIGRTMNALTDVEEALRALDIEL